MLRGVILLARRNNAGLLELGTAQHQHGGITAVVEDHVRRLPRPGEHLLGRPPVVLKTLALPGEDRHALRLFGRSVRTHNRRGSSVVLGGEDVARCPPHFGAQRHQGLDEHRGLNGHVQRTRDARALEGQHIGVLAAQRHQSGHLVFGQPDLFAAVLGQRQVGHLEVDSIADIGSKSHGHYVISTASVRFNGPVACRRPIIE